MYDRYQGLIFDMDGTILDTEPTHHKAWNKVLARYGMTYDAKAMTALNGSPTWRIAQAIIGSHQVDIDPIGWLLKNHRGGGNAVGHGKTPAAYRCRQILSRTPPDGSWNREYPWYGRQTVNTSGPA